MDPHTILLGLVITVVVIALIFDFLNGFHDAANAIATIVITRTLTPAQAVIMAGMAEFLGYFISGVAVAQMVGTGIVNIEIFNQLDLTAGQVANAKLIMLLSALVGAVAWNILTWLFGLPSSSSHALFGGLIGSMLAAVGWKGLALSNELVLFSHKLADGTKQKWGVFHFNALPPLPYEMLKIIAFIFIAPMLGMFFAAVITTAVIWAFRRTRPTTAGAIFKKLQLISAAFYCTGHGRNDAQKTMGVIALALVAGGYREMAGGKLPVDQWVVLACYSAIALGTMFGGWRIVKTMGTKITKIRAMEGCCAESAAGLVLQGTAFLGMPCSTTHVISGSIMGVGLVERAAKVRWVTARTIVWAWILTIPLTAIFTAGVYFLLNALLKPLFGH